jgi:hypothetical protein
MLYNIYLRPISGQFDVLATRRHLLAEPDSLADPCLTDEILLCGFASLVDYLRDKRIASPDRFPACALVLITPEYVQIFQEHANVHKLLSARRFFLWVTAQCDCRIFDEYGTEWTAEYKADGVAVIYPDDLDELAKSET